MAAVYSFVDAFPPKSPVIVFPSAIVYDTSVRDQSMLQPTKHKTYRKGSLFDSVRMLIEIHVPQHHQRGQ